MKRKKNQIKNANKSKKKKTNQEKQIVKEMCPWWCPQKESFSSKLSKNNPFFYRFKNKNKKKSEY